MRYTQVVHMKKLSEAVKKELRAPLTLVVPVEFMYR